jgi:hypothetical protein
MRFLVLAMCVLAPLAQPIQNGHKNPTQTEKTSQQSDREVPPPCGSLYTIDSTVGEANKETTKNNAEKDHKMLLLNTVATTAMAVFALFSVLIYWGQLRALKINERAWIVPIVGVVEPISNSKQFQIKVELRNKGKTPAWVTAAGSRGKGVTDEKPLPGTPSYDEMKPFFSNKGMLLPPEGSFTQGFPFTQEHVDSILAKQSKLFVFGYAKYRDMYKKRHIIRYCFEAGKSLDANHPHPLEFYVGGPDEYWEAD